MSLYSARFLPKRARANNLLAACKILATCFLRMRPARHHSTVHQEESYVAAEVVGHAKPELLVCNLGGDWLSQCRSGASVSYAVLVINRRTASTRAATTPPPRAAKAPHDPISYRRKDCTPPQTRRRTTKRDRGAAPASTNRSGLRGGLAALARAVGVRFPRAVARRGAARRYHANHGRRGLVRPLV